MKNSAAQEEEGIDGILLESLETVPGELMPYVERSRQRRRAQRRRWAIGAAGFAAVMALCFYLLV